MKIIRDINEAKAFTKKSLVVIGNFDGLHLGHRKIITEAQKLAYPNKMGVITFEPHPRDYFLKNSKPFKLTTTEKKYALLGELGVDFVIELKFDQHLECCTPEKFVSIILAKNLEIRSVMVGQDFRFGYKRSGDFRKLKELSREHGINAFAIELDNFGKNTISSTRIRKALERGEIREAKNMLGYWPQIYGEVIRGDQRGRELGFPTVNIELKEILIPRCGVYSCMIEVLSGRFANLYKGAASIGKKPTFGTNEINLEVHIFEFAHEIYGSKVAVSLVNFQRSEEKFGSLESLVKQMQLDCEQASLHLSSFNLSKS